MKLKTLYLLLFFGVISLQCQSQTISTLAGTGIMGYSGDGGPATLANIKLPWGIVVDKNKNVYYTDGTCRIRKIDTAGAITTFAGDGSCSYSGDGGPAIAAGFTTGAGMAIDSSSAIYFCTAGLADSRVRMINASGVISTIAGTGTVGYSGDGGPATSATIRATCVATDNSGNIYLCEWGNNCIRKINAAGIITTFAGNGTGGFSGDGGLATVAQLNGPHGVAVDLAGNVYIADQGNYRIRKVSPTGIITTYAGTGINGFGGDGGPAAIAQISYLRGLAMDNAGSLYLADQVDNQRIRKINSAGIITTITGLGYPTFDGDGGPAIAGGINGPFSIALDGSKNIYFTDRQNNRIRKIAYPNIPLYFSYGDTLSVIVCSEFISLDSILRASDADTGQTLYWSVITPPLHGIASASYSTISTGGTLNPIGTSYAPTFGYSGTDTLRVRVTDGMAADTITLCFNVQQPPVPVAISGPDTVCAGDTMMLTAAIGGSWSNSTGISVSGGSVAGITVGTAMVSYTITNICGSAISTHGVYVKNCPAGVHGSTTQVNALRIYPNPASGAFTVYFTSAIHQDVTITIADITSRKAFELTTQTNVPVPVVGLEPGIYFVSATTPTGIKRYGKIIVTGHE
jgi:hypothetical protein